MVHYDVEPELYAVDKFDAFRDKLLASKDPFLPKLDEAIQAVRQVLNKYPWV